MLEEVGWGERPMGSLGNLTLEDLTCPICMESLKDPFVTPCGHSFCYSCIIIHLQNKKVCPCCSQYLTPDKVFPNYLLSKVVARVAREAQRKAGSLVEQLQAAISSDKQGLRLPDVDILLETLEEKKHHMQQREKENNLELLLHFLNHSKLSKTRKLLELQEELHILDRDIHHVETRQYVLPATAGGLLALPDLANPAWSQRQALQPQAALTGAHQQSVIVGEITEEHGSPAASRDVQRAILNGYSAGRQSPMNGVMHAAQHLVAAEPALEHSLPSHNLRQAQAEGNHQTATVPQAPPIRSLPLRAAPSQALHLASDTATSDSLRPAAHSQQPSRAQEPASSPAPISVRYSSGQQSQLASSRPTSPLETSASPTVTLSHQTDIPAAAAPTVASEQSSGPTSEVTNTSNTTKTSSGPGQWAQGRHRQHFESQFEDLQQHYLRMRQRQMGGVKRRRLDESSDADANADADADEASQAPAGSMPAVQAEVGSASDTRGPPGQGWEASTVAAQPRQGAPSPTEPGGLQEFSRMLTMSRRSKLEVVASIPGASQHTSAAILSSVTFDKDTQMFATAGVSKRIFIYNFENAAEAYGRDSVGQVCGAPAAQLRSRSKLSCLSYNCFHNSQLMSSDYEGVITLWDTHTAHPITEYEAHDKRVWSVDFCPSEAQLLASGSDDGKVKVWSMNQPNSVLDINVRANVCSVKYSPSVPHELAVGSADHNVMIFDTRKHAKPVTVLSGHRKAVSYVLYMNERELVSASTDSTLRLWNAKGGPSLRKFSGHLNEKNFVGLSCEQEFVACGSETSEVFVFYRAMSRPIAKAQIAPIFSGSEAVLRTNSHFISALCWKPRCEKKTLLAANSQGAIKILQLNC